MLEARRRACPRHAPLAVRGEVRGHAWAGGLADIPGLLARAWHGVVHDAARGHSSCTTSAPRISAGAMRGSNELHLFAPPDAASPESSAGAVRCSEELLCHPEAAPPESGEKPEDICWRSLLRCWLGSAPGTVAWSDQAVLVASQCLPPVLQRVEGGGCISCFVSCLAVTCLVLSSCPFVLRRSTRWRVKPRILACVRRMSYARGACTCPA